MGQRRCRDDATVVIDGHPFANSFGDVEEIADDAKNRMEKEL
jgi:hypothetical protein